jgi:hypothetical protein
MLFKPVMNSFKTEIMINCLEKATPQSRTQVPTLLIDVLLRTELLSYRGRHQTATLRDDYTLPFLDTHYATSHVGHMNYVSKFSTG